MERPWQSEFVRGTHHVNGSENFWSYAKERLGQFHGSVQEKFYWHLEECEDRFNLRKNHL
jgi:transposase-like protein